MKKILTLIMVPLILTACGPQKISTPTSQPEKTVETAVLEEPVQEEATPQVKVESLTEGLVVFTAGDVYVTREGQEESLDIGDTLLQDDVVGTGPDSYCEIQLGEIAVVRMEENSIITMSSLLTTDKGSKMGVDLEEGQVLCKVRKLLEEDTFKVKAGTVVCGVRGTQFGVSAKGDDDVLLAVKEGAVAVTPASLEEVSELAAGEESLKGVAAIIQQASMVVGASEEMTIQEEAFKELEEIAPVLEEVVKKIEEKKAVQEKTGAQTTEQSAEEAKALEEAMAVIEKEVTSKVEEILAVIEENPHLVAPVALEKTAISEESKKTLESTEEMELIAYSEPETPAEEADSSTTGQEESKTAPVVPNLYKVNITVEPAEAEILSSGRLMSKGKFTKIYAEGKTLSFEIRMDGYKSQTLNLSVDESVQASYPIVLEPEEDLNTALPIEEAAPEADLPVVAPVEEAAAESETAAEPVALSLSTQPSDAAISIDGRSVGKGSWSGEAADGTILKVRVERNGYAPVDLNLTAAAGGVNRVVTLEPRPVEVKTSFASGNLVASLQGEPDMMIGADNTGKLTAFNRSGTVLWQFQSDNSPNANSSAVIHNGKVYFSGGTELVILNSRDGSLVSRSPLGEDRSHIYGRQVMPLGDRVFFPANGELVIMDGSGNEKGTYTIPESSSMSPTVWNGNILIADKKGSLLVMDPSSGNVLSSVSTGSLQVVAQSPAVQGNKAVFASRKGVVSAVDLDKGSVLWERDLDRTVFANIVAVEEGCYVYTTKREVFALSWESGDDLFTPLVNISAAPGYANGLLYVTSRDGVMSVLNAGNGEEEGRLELQDSFTARPIIRDGIIFGVGTNGNFYRINTAGIK